MGDATDDAFNAALGAELEARDVTKILRVHCSLAGTVCEAFRAFWNENNDGRYECPKCRRTTGKNTV